MDEIFPEIDPLVSHNTLDVIISLLTLSKPDTLTKQLTAGIKNNIDTKGFLRDTDQGLVDYYKSLGLETKIFENVVKDFFANVTMDSLRPILQMVWFSKLPCFDVPGITGTFEGENTFLKYCSWKGKAIFY